MQITIDRFEADYAIVEYTDQQGKESFAKIARVLLPGAKEGDILDLTINRAATEQRAHKIEKLMEDLFEDG